jgi:hypothetical protein
VTASLTPRFRTGAFLCVRQGALNSLVKVRGDVLVALVGLALLQLITGNACSDPGASESQGAGDLLPSTFTIRSSFLRAASWAIGSVA